MARAGRDAASGRVERARKRVERWRSAKHRRGAPMPAGLWNEASQLARELGVHPIKRALGLNYGSLKRRVAGVSRERVRGKSPGFVELSGAQVLGASRAAVVEVSDADGGRLRVELGLGSGLDVASVVEAFRRRA